MRNKLILSLLAVLLWIVPAKAGETVDIIAVNFPAYDIARSVCGENAAVELLLPPGSESHSYEPTPQDMIAIQNADLFIFTGGESDHWLESLIASMGSDAPAVFRMADCIVPLEEEHEHEDHHHSEEHVHEMDEHVWTSPRNVMQIAQALAAVLGPDTAPAEKLDAYLKELSDLDEAFRETVSSGVRRKMVFGDRFPMRYFAHEYGLDYEAAFPGCSEDSEPSVRTVISLVDLIREEEIPVVFYIEFSSRRTADILCEETGAKALLFHSCHNVSAAEMEAGATYLSLMRNNLEALKEALR